jgi:hypothetical protein
MTPIVETTKEMTGLLRKRLTTVLYFQPNHYRMIIKNSEAIITPKKISIGSLAFNQAFNGF